MASDGGGTTPLTPPPNAVAGRYRIAGRLGRGGMGTVWQATDELLRRQVAVKELHLDDGGLSPRQLAIRRERALREARSAALIRHPHVVVVHDVVEHEGHPWIVMELVDGRSLALVLEQDGPLPPREAARVGAAVAGALCAAHERGIQHRDVKPGNVLVAHGTGHVVLTDFGIARVPGAATISETGGFIGSPEYTAPERMSGRATGAPADLWSLGVLLCTAVHGQSPFRRDSIGEIVHAVAIGDIAPPGVLGPLLPIVTRLLDRDPETRMDAAEARLRLTAVAEVPADAAPETPEPTGPTEVSGAPAAKEPAGPEASHERAEAPAREEEAEARTHHERAPEPEADPSAPDSSTPSVPTAGAPSSHRAPGRRRVGGLRVAAVGALVLLTLGVGALTAVLLSRGRGDGPHAAPATASPPPATAGYPPPPGSRRQLGPPPLGADPRGSALPPGSGPPPGAPGTPPLPQGVHLVRDKAHFAFALPSGYVRTPHPPTTYYWSPGHVLRVGEREQEPDPRGPYEALKDRQAHGGRTYAGYRDAALSQAVQHGQPAALWEFTYDDGRPRREFDVCWTDENGRMYDLSLSAPAEKASEGLGVFDTARATFWPG
jgi:eukaryotic-like serine/threonine-protein kinase